MILRRNPDYWAQHSFKLRCWNDGLDVRRNAMVHLFLTPSPLLAAGEVLVGISLPMFVAALIAAYGDRIRLSGGRWARTFFFFFFFFFFF